MSCFKRLFPVAIVFAIVLSVCVFSASASSSSTQSPQSVVVSFDGNFKVFAATGSDPSVLGLAYCTCTSSPVSVEAGLYSFTLSMPSGYKSGISSDYYYYQGGPLVSAKYGSRRSYAGIDQPVFGTKKGVIYFNQSASNVVFTFYSYWADDSISPFSTSPFNLTLDPVTSFAPADSGGSSGGDSGGGSSDPANPTVETLLMRVFTDIQATGKGNFSTTILDPASKSLTYQPGYVFESATQAYYNPIQQHFEMPLYSMLAQELYNIGFWSSKNVSTLTDLYHFLSSGLGAYSDGAPSLGVLLSDVFSTSLMRLSTTNVESMAKMVNDLIPSTAQDDVAEADAAISSSGARETMQDLSNAVASGDFSKTELADVADVVSGDGMYDTSYGLYSDDTNKWFDGDDDAVDSWYDIDAIKERAGIG